MAANETHQCPVASCFWPEQKTILPQAQTGDTSSQKTDATKGSKKGLQERKKNAKEKGAGTEDDGERKLLILYDRSRGAIPIHITGEEPGTQYQSSSSAPFEGCKASGTWVHCQEFSTIWSNLPHLCVFAPLRFDVAPAKAAAKAAEEDAQVVGGKKKKKSKKVRHGAEVKMSAATVVIPDQEKEGRKPAKLGKGKKLNKKAEGGVVAGDDDVEEGGRSFKGV